MKNIWSTLKQNHWHNRSARERRILLLAVAVLTPLLGYMALWQPAHQATAKLHNTLPTLRSQAAQLQADVKEVEKLRHLPQPATLDGPALKTALEESASRHQLRTAIASIEIQPPNAVRVSAAAVPFANWTNWLRELQQVQHIRIESTSINALPQTGMVRVNATFTQGGLQ